MIKTLLIILIILLLILCLKNKKNIETYKHYIDIQKIDFRTLNLDQLKKYLKSEKPIIFTNVIKNNIKFDDFCRKLKDKKINIRTGNYGSVNGRKKRTFFKQTMNKYCKNIKKNKFYGGNNLITESELQEIDLKPNNIFLKHFRKGKLWIGPKNSRTPLHKDKPENLALQIYGKKKWIIYDRKDIKYLCYPKNNKILEWSNYDINNIKSCNKAIKAQPIELIINEGEMLYLPKQWSHDVINLTDSIMINFWYLNSNKLPFLI